ncbi:MAG: hypothetical protein COX19_01220 [Desulfobacterales bacterium CG23_combo_of_CG06-09_8_20_14_all_51_8]|nr:MAG: hypothetical protein COX19_01220 [Desulfobacterales bacterium CG23_combo_of_CG06-09_8_20_14_all_51_8]
MKKFLILFLALFLCTPAMAENWTDNLEMGGDVRMMYYSLNNFFDYNSGSDIDDWEVFRLRTRLKTKITLSDDVSGFVQIANQTYGENIGEPETNQKNKDLNFLGFNFDNYEADNKSDKVFVDNAYITAKNMFNTGITLQTGRMNLMYGSGFVLFDGQSQAASTSLYFDGIKLSAPFGEKTNLDLLYFIDQENARWNVKEDDVSVMGAYLTAHCPFLGGQQEFYVLNKNDENLGAATPHTEVTNEFENTDGELIDLVVEEPYLEYNPFEKDIWMIGLRFSDKMKNGLDYSLEGAYQFGDFNKEADIEQDAFGGKFDGGFTFKDAPMAPRLFVGYAYMQGDDPDTTDKKERWDHFYGGWPQFGDILA